jgi:pimeloyl-ACP methyl ester carboxylesterase
MCGSQGFSMSPPETPYARAGDVSIAYQVSGSGPFDLIFVPGFVSNLDVHWETPGFSDLFVRLERFSRLIRFDKRGTGLSDRVAGIPNLDERMDDVRAVMDAAGSSRAALFGMSEGGPMSRLFAATYPERARACAAASRVTRRLPIRRYCRAILYRSKASGAPGSLWLATRSRPRLPTRR